MLGIPLTLDLLNVRGRVKEKRKKAILCIKGYFNKIKQGFTFLEISCVFPPIIAFIAFIYFLCCLKYL